jgi:hypothetical protein
MGLDVSAYQQMRLIDACVNERGEIIDPKTGNELSDTVEVWDNPDFEGRAAPLHSGNFYSYEETTEVVSHGYSGFSRWRDTLAKISGWALAEYTSFGVKGYSHAASAWAATEGPFWELINFSDCEGFIGTEACKKLSGDFEKYKEAASNEEENFYILYLRWKEGVSFAAENGALEFH